MLSIIKRCYLLGFIFTSKTNYRSLEVVDRGSETQLQVAENWIFLAQCSKDVAPLPATGTVKYVLKCRIL